MRNLLIARVCGADSELIAATPDQWPAIAKAAALFSEEDLTRFFQILLQTDDDLRRKPDPRVHLEMGLLRLINAARLAPLEELLAELKSGAPSAARTGIARASSAALPQARTATLSTAPAFTPPPLRSAPSAASTSTPAPRTETNPQAFPAPLPSAPPPAAATAPSTEIKAPNGNPREIRVSGISQGQVAEIKSAIQAQQKFLGELLEHSSGWELEGAELRIYFSADKRAFAEMIEGREPLEKIRAVSSNALGRPVRVCARLDSVAAAAAAASGTQELRAQFERDPLVRSTEVRSRQEEK